MPVLRFVDCQRRLSTTGRPIGIGQEIFDWGTNLAREIAAVRVENTALNL